MPVAKLRSRGAVGCVAGLLILASTLAAPPSVSGQELEPRAYRTIPVGLNFVLFTYIFSSGNVVTDVASPVQDLDLNLSIFAVSYMRSLGLFGRSSSFTISVPYGFISGSGRLQGELVSDSRSGAADTQMRLVVNLLGGPAMTPKEYAEFGQRRNLGVSLTMVPPSGQYDPTRFVNFGTNRWSFKPEIGYSSIKGRWILDAAVGVWFFTTNDNFVGLRREQDPIGSVQAHVSYNFTPSIWLALDTNYFTGGRTTIGGEEKADLQRNSRVGLTLSLPLRPRHSLRLAAERGAFTSIGADFDRVRIFYLFGW
ncbi:MAG: transporter [Thermoanaerobaculia bacterium]